MAMDPQMKSELRQKVQQYFVEFLSNFKMPTADGDYEAEFYYIDQAKDMVNHGRKTLYVRMSHFDLIDDKAISFGRDDLKQAIVSKYLLVRDNLNAAVSILLDRIEDPAFEAQLAKVRGEQDDTKWTVSFLDMSTYSGIRDLRTDGLGRMQTICGTVTRMTEVKPELIVGTYQCIDCDTIITGVEQQFKVTQPAICTKRNCNNRSNWKMLGEHKATQWGDWQRIRLQENENEVPAGSMPRSIDVVVRDEVTENVKPGDKVLVTGCLIVVPDVPSMMSPQELKSSVRRNLETRTDGADGVRGLKGLGQRDLTYKMSFFGCWIEEDSDWGTLGAKGQGSAENIRSDGKVYLSQGDKEKLFGISDHVDGNGKRDVFNVLAKAIAPAVCGHNDVKKGILLMLVGGMGKKTAEGIKLRGDLNMCILGDPSTSKSAMLKWVAGFLPRAVFCSGKTSSAAGLTASVTRDADLDNEKVIEPGALMLADNGICCIDEFETMDQKDQVAIHEAMEQQTITLAKAGIKATLNARASILAACLPKNVYYNTTLPLHKNVDISPPIMSRFDMFFVIQDIHDVSQDKHVADHIMAQHLAAYTEEEAVPHLSTEELQKYIRLARQLSPKITPEARERLIKCYKKMRESHNYVRAAAGVTVRSLESLIRLSESLARIYLSLKITAEIVQEAYELKEFSLRKVQSENIDLGEDLAAEAPPAPADAAAEGAEGVAADQAAAQAARGRHKISYAEYQRIGMMLVRYLNDQFEADKETTEEDLMDWYMESIENEIETEAQLYEKQRLVQNIIRRLVDRDNVIIAAKLSADPLRPELRVLQKHPNYPLDTAIGSTKKATKA